MCVYDDDNNNNDDNDDDNNNANNTHHHHYYYRCLFEAARALAPSIVFLDEVDALVSSRGADGEHEASRRLKTEFFCQMDGIASVGSGVGSSSSSDGSSSSSGGEERMMVLATTNCPWDLDEAMRLIKHAM